MKKSEIAILIIFLVLIGIIFKNWFISVNIVGGDWPFFFQHYVDQFSYLPPVWNSAQGNGLGGQSVIYALDSYLYFTGWFFSVLLHIPWPVVYKIFWFGLFLVLSSWSSFFLFKTVFPKSLIWQRLLAAFLYTTNTYILLVAGGGQMGVALAYSMAPLVFAQFIILSENLFINDNQTVFLNASLAGLLLSILVLFDFRFAYIIMCAVLLYIVVGYTFKLKQTLTILLYLIVIPLFITILLHAYWLFPLIIFRQNPALTLGSAYTSVASLQFFSFATFSNAIGLLHPYWPDNVFGKISFMKPEYLVLPVLAFSSLFFLNSKIKSKKLKAQVKSQKFYHNLTIEQFSRRYILYFTLLGLIGVFLAKGSNDPFGGIFIWMFQHVPGFIMFRDPTKFYLLIALSYSILIPFSLRAIVEIVSSIKFQIVRKYSRYIIIAIFLVFWLFTIRQAVFGQLNGTFTHHEVPAEYVQLKNILIKDPQFSRTLWLPKLQRFGYYDQLHPAVEAGPLLSVTDLAGFKKKLTAKTTENYLSDLGVKYIIIPDDVYGEIFLDDGKYSQKKRDEYKKILDSISWIKKIQDNGITIYVTKKHKDHFWLQQGNGQVKYTMISPTLYRLDLNNVKKNDILIFSENYSPYWVGTIGFGNYQYLQNKDSNALNNFILPNSGNYTVIMSYLPYKYFILGRVISVVVLLLLIINFFLISFINRKFFI